MAKKLQRCSFWSGGCKKKRWRGSKTFCYKHALPEEKAKDNGELHDAAGILADMKSPLASQKLPKRNQYDGMIMEFKVDESVLPERLPICPPARSGARVLLKVEDDLSPLYHHISEKIKSVWPEVWKVTCYNPQFIASPECSVRDRWTDGLAHRDTPREQSGRLTAIIYFDDLDSGGIKFWIDSHNFRGGHDFLSNRPRHLMEHLQRGFEEVISLPKKYTCVLFDSRLLHQSLVYLGDDCQRLALGIMVATNNLETEKDITELTEPDGYRSRRRC
jgi:hypothetical protein